MRSSYGDGMHPSEAERGEFAALARIAALLPYRAAGGQVWIGDDAALLAPLARPLLAIDTVVEGVHADLTRSSVADFGWRAVVVNVSDIAAMAGSPIACVVAVSGPPTTDLDELYEGIAEASAEYQVPVVGGDLTNGPFLVVSVAIVGEARQGGPVLRSGARADDEVWVTGPLGAAAAAVRTAHPVGRPRARLEEGHAAAAVGATAMIDVSDGLGADLGHVLDASGVGAALDGLPVAPGATEDDALGGGEDYELLFTAPAGAPVARHFAERGLREPIRIGVCTAALERTLRGRPLPRRGWEHEWRGPSR